MHYKSYTSKHKFKTKYTYLLRVVQYAWITEEIKIGSKIHQERFI